MQVTRAEAQQNIWRRMDRDAAIDVNGKVAHGLTSESNFFGAAVDVVEALPDKTIAITAMAISNGESASEIFSAFLLGLWLDVAECLCMPFFLIKDLAEGIGHGIVSLFTEDKEIMIKPSEHYGRFAAEALLGSEYVAKADTPAINPMRAVANVGPELSAPSRGAN